MSDMYFPCFLQTQDVDVDTIFSYGPSGGEKKMLQQLSEFLTEEYGNTVDWYNII